MISTPEPWFLLIPTKQSDTSEYLEQLSVRDIFRVKSTSVQTSRDDFVVDFSRGALKDRIELLGGKSPDKLFRDEYRLNDGRDWNLISARDDIRTSSDWENSIIKYLYRVFDIREICYRDSLINWPRHEVMDNLSQNNIALLIPRQLAGQEFRHVFCTRLVCDMCVVSTATKEAVQTHPLFLNSARNMLSSPSIGLEANFTEQFKQQVKRRLGFECDEEINAKACFYYIYTILHSPGYRSRYADFLRIDFPRIPFTSNLGLFRALSQLGGELVTVHLLESPKLSKPITKWKGKMPSNEVKIVTYSDETVWIDKAQTEGFNGVPEAVWDFHIGGYQVCEKWLKDRKGRVLSAEDINHYQKIVVALNETIRLMKEIDEVIDQHGGWPGAFQ